VGEASGELNFYRNEGTPAEPRFTLVSDRWLGIDVGQRSFPVLEDIDGDGDLDLVVGSESGGVLLFLNEGTPEEPVFREVPGGLGVPHFGHAAPAFADLDGDGRRELILGGSRGGLWYFERR
jgi:large repetitive protein